MNRLLFKMFFRKIKKGWRAFLTMILIVILGVGFLVGLFSTAPDMWATMNKVCITNKIADVNIKSDTVFSYATIEELKKEDMIAEVVGTIEQELIVEMKGELNLARIIYRKFSPDAVNQLTLLEGNYPAANNECIVIQPSTGFKSFDIDDSIYINSEEYRIVGIVSDPWYFSRDQLKSQSTNENLSSIIYLNLEDTQTHFTDLYLTLNNRAKFNLYEKKYENELTALKTHLTSNKELYFGLEREIYLLDLNDNQSFYLYNLNVQKIEDISFLFPVFFFLIAALVFLSTTTRMVNEERMIIGTLRSLGYSKITVFFQYFLYALFTSGIGTLLGTALGIALIPEVIYYVFKSTFYLPKLLIQYDFFYVELASFLMIGSVLIVTIVTCANTLREKPSQLLLRKAPKPGKKIFLERIGFIWKRLKFRYKSTLRNLFRHKKNFIMMVLGVSGCTALMLVGFGLRDSIDKTANVQYQEILHYDMISTVNDIEKLELADFENITDYLEIYTEDVKAQNDNQLDIKVMAGDFSNQRFVTLREKKKSLINYHVDSAVITGQIADKLSLKLGDYLEIITKDQHVIKVLITDITENYVGNYLYINIAKWQERKNSDAITANTVLLKTDLITIEEQTQLARTILSDDNFTNIEIIQVTKESYANLFNNLDYIVVVVILFAGMLAFTVIFNLTNINIEEREREIATLKVLGYQSVEIAGYIYRETVLMTIIGMLVGLVLGVFLHQIIVIKVENYGMMFGREIKFWSYLYSAILTLAFSAIVDILFIRKMARISMVSSLKAIE